MKHLTAIEWTTRQGLTAMLAVRKTKHGEISILIHEYSSAKIYEFFIPRDAVAAVASALLAAQQED